MNLLILSSKWILSFFIFVMHTFIAYKAFPRCWHTKAHFTELTYTTVWSLRDCCNKRRHKWNGRGLYCARSININESYKWSTRAKYRTDCEVVFIDIYSWTISVCGTYKHIRDKVPALRSLQSNSKRWHPSEHVSVSWASLLSIVIP